MAFRFSDRAAKSSAARSTASFSAVVVFLNLTFVSGVNLSVGTPVIRMAGITLASLLGILVFGEGISWRYVLGFALAVLGLYFIVTK